MKLYFKSMVSERCIMIVTQELAKLNIRVVSVALGTAETLDVVSESQRSQIKEKLLSYGLDLITDKKSILIEKIKNTIIEMVHYRDKVLTTNFSDYISEKLHYDYTYLANVFSQGKGMTIQQFIIINRIEKIKELLLYDELNLSEISQKLHYSSASHLSNQFKKITGYAPSLFKRMKQGRKTNLEDL